MARLVTVMAMGHSQSIDHLLTGTGDEPSMGQVVGAPTADPGSLAPLGTPRNRHGPRRGSRIAGIRAAVWRLVRSRVDLAVQLLLLLGLGLVQWTNMLHWPAVLFDEGTYVGNAWAVGSRGELAFYTYTYGHPPLEWLLITLWTSAGRLFGHIPSTHWTGHASS